MNHHLLHAVSMTADDVTRIELDLSVFTGLNGEDESAGKYIRISGNILLQDNVKGSALEQTANFGTLGFF